MAKNALEDGSRPFLSDAHGSRTRAQIWERTQRVASGFRSLGLESGDRVALMLDNSVEFVETWFGLATASLVQVPLNPAILGERLIHAMAHSGATALVADVGYVSQFEQIASELPKLRTIVVVGGKAKTSFEQVPFEQIRSADIGELPVVTCADTTAIMYTSGSTGPAKGVVVPHGQHYMNGWQATRQAEIGHDDRIFVTLPLHHNMAQGYGVMAGVVSGAEVYLSTGFKRATFWNEVISSGSTVFPFVGSILALLAAQKGPSENPLRVAYGVPVPPSLHEEFEKRFGLRLIDGYGSTEGTIPAWGSVRGDRAIGSSGRVVPEFEVEILDERDVPVRTGEIGQICIRSREPFSMFQGYFNDYKRTVDALRNFWFHSGDRGRFDEQGNLWFEGRIDDVMRRFGEFISAKEVEAAIVKHDAVELVAAYGVASEVAGQEVMVAVILKEGRTLSAEELRAHCENYLPAFAIPRFVEFFDELPMTPTGKIEKHKLRARGVSQASFDARRDKDRSK
ncbi:AMP-binding protein [Arthrobacter sp. FW306-2-2C-D06B]|uniref:AMP-binding protein n=1 Tax=Arthrobacter sp. FW306-2-2C-D06B TaxID=2879618 RepID=UPI001F48DF8E|nr:AMP-binding protein [Arthrobacter sp. FW306-2-2C-D06B]UKA60455.1 AMP-binding protein [Arthrobacter sp. FW306-2-2C-D06B]